MFPLYDHLSLGKLAVNGRNKDPCRWYPEGSFRTLGRTMTLDFFLRTGQLGSQCDKGGRTNHRVCPDHLLIRRFSTVDLPSDRRTYLVSLIRLLVGWYFKTSSEEPRMRRFLVEK
jgi:hypothetical protein